MANSASASQTDAVNKNKEALSFDMQLQTPAYQRRSRWSAKQALTSRGIIFEQQKNVMDTEVKPLKDQRLRVRKIERNLKAAENKHFILSGKMSNVCAMLEKIEQAGGGMKN